MTASEGQPLEPDPAGLPDADAGGPPDPTAQPGQATQPAQAGRPDAGAWPEPGLHTVLPPRSRGVIALLEENCTVCMLCARECPDWCLYIDSHQEVIPPGTEGGRPRTRHVLDRFAIDFGLCMYCGICIEVCPFDALFWSPEFGYPAPDATDLVHERDRLQQWLPTVPAPPPLDPAAGPAKEAAPGDR